MERMMSHTFVAHFDGKVLVPDEPVDLPVGMPLRLKFEVVQETPSRFADFLDLAVDLPDAPTDLALQHDHYLYGSPKR
jgi:hypothetical protein